MAWWQFLLIMAFLVFNNINTNDIMSRLDELDSKIDDLASKLEAVHADRHEEEDEYEEE